MMTHIFIKHSNTFWEVVPPTKTGMRKLLAYIRMCKRAEAEWRKGKAKGNL